MGRAARCSGLGAAPRQLACCLEDDEMPCRRASTPFKLIPCLHWTPHAIPASRWQSQRYEVESKGAPVRVCGQGSIHNRPESNSVGMSVLSRTIYRCTRGQPRAASHAVMQTVGGGAAPWLCRNCCTVDRCCMAFRPDNSPILSDVRCDRMTGSGGAQRRSCSSDNGGWVGPSYQQR